MVELLITHLQRLDFPVPKSVSLSVEAILVFFSAKNMCSKLKKFESAFFIRFNY